MPKPIGLKFHGVLDYLSVLLLFAAGPVVGFDGIASQITSTLAGVVLVYSAATSYPLGLVRLISFKGHLILDAVLAVGAILSPWIFGFSGDPKACYFFVVYGVFVLIVVGLSDSRNVKSS
ncbi:MAG TPA: SPW repeat protein [Gemmatimonadaceae bacterium]|nr:SPW repeat protein [Gemmatimonadaceae bacterium]